MSMGPSIGWHALYKLPHGHLKSWAVNNQINPYGTAVNKRLLEIWIDLKKPPHDLLVNPHLRGFKEFKLKVFYSDHTEVLAEMDLEQLLDGTFRWTSDVPLKHFKGVKKHHVKSKLVSWSAKRNYHKKRLIKVYYQVKNLAIPPHDELLAPKEIEELQAIAARLQTFIDGYRNDYRIAKNIHII